MKKSILATLFHCTSSNTSDCHVYCPEGEDSWCGFKADKATGKSTFKHGKGLPLK